MPLLVLFRHGKSDWDAEYASDHERPLAKRGKRAAAAMGAWLTAADRVPDRAATSSARRARETLRIAAEAGAWRCPIESRDDLYGVSPAAVLAILRSEPDSTATLVLVGHEPTWSELASQLLGGGSIGMPTAAMAGIDLESWPAVEPGAGRLLWLQHPRMLQS